MSDLPPFMDGEAIRADLTTIALSEDLSEAERRTSVLDYLRRLREQGLKSAEQDLNEGTDGREVARFISRLHDLLIQVLYDYTTVHMYRSRNPTQAERFSIVAVGGYGRGDLAPGSDIDLLFLLPYKQTPWGESVVEFMLYILWDLGLKVGHSTRTIDQCIRLSIEDITIRTSLLEMRYLWGDETLFQELKDAYWSKVVEGTEGEFVQLKLQERDLRHERAGSSRYLVEPNLKEGKGGLRDLNTLFWIAKYIYNVDEDHKLLEIGLLTDEEYNMLVHAYSHLWTVRCHLHFLRGRAEEKLTFDVQPELAERLNYEDTEAQSAVELFMKDYFWVAKNVGDLTRIFCASLEDRYSIRWPRLRRLLGFTGRRNLDQEGFFIENGRLNIEGPEVFQEDPINLIRLFHIADQKSADIHPEALRVVKQHLHLIDDPFRENKEANAIFRDLLTSERDPEWELRRMSEAGVLGRFVPEFGKVEAMMQFNMYHHYTVDEHTIRAMGILSQIERGEFKDEHPLSHEIIHKIHDRDILFVALFLHDIAKGRPEDHSEAGAEIALSFCPRLAMTNKQTETVSWLVKHHLLMSEFAQSRDISDPQTIAAFTKTVQSTERLRLLLVLTVADIRAVGPGVWNGWKGQLLRDLYYEAENVLQHGQAPGSASHQAHRVEEAKEALRARFSGWSKSDIETALSRHGDSYWLSFDTDSHFRHADALRSGEQAGEDVVVTHASDPFQSITELMVVTDDRLGLFSGLAGTLSMNGATIKDAKIFTTKDNKALDVFYIQDTQGKPFDDQSRLARLIDGVKGLARQELDPADKIPRPKLGSREQPFTVETQVVFDNDVSDIYTVLEVTSRDRPGLLYDLTQALLKLQISLVSAHIATYGEEAVDVFYVKDRAGRKINKETDQEAVRSDIVKAVDQYSLQSANAAA